MGWFQNQDFKEDSYAVLSAVKELFETYTQLDSGWDRRMQVSRVCVCWPPFYPKLFPGSSGQTQDMLERSYLLADLGCLCTLPERPARERELSAYLLRLLLL